VKYNEYQTEDARLVILKELALQADGRLNEALLEKVLDAFGYLRSREWIRTQMRKLEEIGAIQITEVGTVLVAAITRAGLDHVHRRTALDGVARPSPGN
jgi:repressor of nif and glnA expression